MSKRTASTISRLLLAFVLCSVANPAQAQKASGDRFIGTWAGKWEGGGSNGNIELSIARESDKLVGKVTATTDNGEYNAAFKSLSFDGNKMTAVYDMPAMENVEITLISTFDGDAATGTWSAHEKGQTTELMGGPWTAKKK